eukprot:CAMPEP_0198310172 /NCGR_PEP_ID=MMETSP1450-20131203/2330_1 /TAXON_ID=753684 ORGANISM="Madagascaria erythrocladiodes, Strain CCMP3234" /NCGR_SAMPLE_ID=MMETSP1450 /ASSEMBLY_ACC=CAM_ASM_001115 /LENGTH=374 /DNA_ID=CAMNT_0044012985 /DNA_START=50 /DNA_END=1174 /DNA_ORIENTATION=+
MPIGEDVGRVDGIRPRTDQLPRPEPIYDGLDELVPLLENDRNRHPNNYYLDDVLERIFEQSVTEEFNENTAANRIRPPPTLPGAEIDDHQVDRLPIDATRGEQRPGEVRIEDVAVAGTQLLSSPTGRGDEEKGMQGQYSGDMCHSAAGTRSGVAGRETVTETDNSGQSSTLPNLDAPNEEDPNTHPDEETGTNCNSDSEYTEGTACFAGRQTYSEKIWLLSSYDKLFLNYLARHPEIDDKPVSYSKWREKKPGVEGRCCGFCHHLRFRKRSADGESKRFCATVVEKGLCHYHWKVLRTFLLKTNKGVLNPTSVQPRVTSGRSCMPGGHIATDSRDGFERFRANAGLEKCCNLAVLLEVTYVGECVQCREETGSG